MMETRAVLKGVRLSPQKGRMVADLIRGKKVDQALNILASPPKREPSLLRRFWKARLRTLSTMMVLMLMS